MSDQLSSELKSLRIARDEKLPRPKPWKQLRWIAAGAGILALLLLVLVPMIGRNIFKTQVETTEVIAASPARATVQLTASGYVVPQRVSKVGAKITGRIAKVYVREGDAVKEGQLMAELEDAQERSNIAVAQANVRAAEAQLSEIAQQTERQKLLAAEGITARATVEDLEARRASLEAAHDAAKAQVDVLRTALSYMEIVSPLSGVVISKPAEPGVLVGVMAADIAEVADLSSLMVEVDVPERRISQVVVENPCEVVLDAYPAKRLRCRVHEVGRKVDRSKATVTVKAAFVEIPPEALPDMSARVSFLTQELPPELMNKPDELLVPKSAVVGEGDEAAVFVIRDGKARRESIAIDEDRGDYYRLARGPLPGTRIVDNPPEGISDGHPVKEKQP